MLLCCGQAIVDRIFTTSNAVLLSHGITPGERRIVSPAELKDLERKFAITKSIECSGGGSANTLAVYAALGGKAVFLTGVGDDKLAQVFCRDLEEAGVEVKAKVLKEHSTGTCLVAVSEGGMRTMFLAPGAAAHLGFAERDFERAKSGDWLFVDAYSLFSSTPNLVANLIEEGRKRDISVAFSLSDPDVVAAKRKEIESLSTAIAVLIGNEIEAAALGAGIETLGSLGRVITKGAQGATVHDSSSVLQIPANRASVVDTTGAGDAFAGALLFGLSNSLSLAESAKRAIPVAAAAVGVLGARLSKQEILAAWNKKSPLWN